MAVKLTPFAKILIGAIVVVGSGSGGSAGRWVRLWVAARPDKIPVFRDRRPRRPRRCPSGPPHPMPP